MDSRILARETEAAARLKEKLIAAYGEDSALIADMIEGSTSLHEAIGKAALELAVVEGEKDGIEIALAKMKERLSRHCRRAEGIREAIQAALETAELPKIKTPAATLSMRTNPPRVEITDATQIPDAFMVHPAPVPDKNAIKDALKDGESIPGCVLSNQPPSLAVRFS